MNTLNKFGFCVALCFIFLGGCAPKTELEQAVENATAGNVNAQFNLGVMYRDGQGVSQNYKEAVKWFRLAAERGVRGAQNNLGVMYADGLGVSQDDAEAVKWYLLAAEQGYPNAQFNLGNAYRDGKGVAQDYAEAYVWFYLVAVRGDSVAEENRDLAARNLTPEQFSEAFSRATDLYVKYGSR